MIQRPFLPNRRRRAAVLLAIAVLIAALGVPTGPVAAVQVAAAPPGNPRVISGTFTGMRDVRGDYTYGTVASMAIPQGRWFITAKAYLQSTPSLIVTCRLVAGSDSHLMTTLLKQGASGSGQWQSFIVMTTHRFTAPGTARLQCHNSFKTGDAIIRQIRITAMAVGTLTTTVFGNPPTTVGSGKPEVRALSRDGTVQVNGGMVLHDVATLNLPAGLWWITAAANVARNSPGDIACRLETPVDYDEVASTTDGFNDAAPVNVQVTHKFDGAGAVSLRCRADVDQFVSNTRIVAVRAGHLTNRQIGGAVFDYGSGTPRIISGFRDDGGSIGSAATTVASLALPAGSWLLFAKFYAEPDVYGLHGNCKLVAGSPVDRIDEALAGDAYTTMSLLGAHTFGAEGGTARLVCTSGSPGFTIHADWVKLTAIKASGLTTRAL